MGLAELPCITLLTKRRKIELKAEFIQFYKQWLSNYLVYGN